MAYLLALETATKVCSVALFDNDKLLISKEQNGSYSHAENLASFVESILKEVKVDTKELSAIAVSKGPGSYTGLRIGVSFAKGLCYALNIPLISIDTLKSMAWGCEVEEEALICPMIDARRMEVYAAVYTANLEELKPIAADIIDETSYADYLKGKKVYFIGDGASKCEAVLTHENAVFKESFPSAKYMGALAFSKYSAQDFEDVAYFEPYYLKEFIAIKSKKLV